MTFDQLVNGVSDADEQYRRSNGPIRKYLNRIRHGYPGSLVMDPIELVYDWDDRDVMRQLRQKLKDVIGRGVLGEIRRRVSLHVLFGSDKPSTFAFLRDDDLSKHSLPDL